MLPDNNVVRERKRKVYLWDAIFSKVLNNTWLNHAFTISAEFEVAFPSRGLKVQRCVLLRGHSPSFGEEIKLSDIKSIAMCLWFNTWGSGLRSKPLRFISWFCNQPFLRTSTSHLSLCFNFLILRETELREGDMTGCEWKEPEKEKSFFPWFFFFFAGGSVVLHLSDGHILNAIII